MTTSSKTSNAPDPVVLLSDGRIDLHRARVIEQGTSHLDPDERTALVDSIVSDIPDLTSGEHNTDTHWQYTYVDENGNVVDTGLIRRRFSPAQKRLIEATHQTCGFPGCRMPAGDCDLDHTQPFAQHGPTRTENGTPECRHDHILIHRGCWKHRVINGHHIWTSPLGHTYINTGQSP